MGTEWGTRRRLFSQGLQGNALLVIAVRMCTAGLLPPFSVWRSDDAIGVPQYGPTDMGISKEFFSTFCEARTLLFPKAFLFLL